MDTIANRLLAFRGQADLSKKAFADKVGLDSGLYGRYESGANKPSFETLEKITSTFPRLNLNWLMMGHGEMFLESIARREAAPAAPTTGATTVFEAENVLLREMNAAQAAHIAAQQEQIAKLWAELGKSGGSSEAASTWRLPMLPVMGREMAYAGR